jgi:hypothetical protein
VTATGQTRTSGAVADDGLPDLTRSASGLLSKLLSDAKTGPDSGSLSYEAISYGGDGRIRTAEWRFCKPLP